MVSECWGVYVTSEQQTGSAFRMVCNAGLWVFTHFPCLRGQDGSFWANCDCTQRIITDPVWGLLLFCFAAFLEFRLESEVWLNLLFVMSPLSMTILSAMQTFGLPVFSACLLTPAKVWNKKKTFWFSSISHESPRELGTNRSHLHRCLRFVNVTKVPCYQ